jgi:hypothetical protein
MKQNGIRCSKSKKENKYKWSISSYSARTAPGASALPTSCEPPNMLPTCRANCWSQPHWPSFFHHLSFTLPIKGRDHLLFLYFFFSKFLKLQPNSSNKLNLNGHGEERTDQTCGNWGPIWIQFWFYNLAKKQKPIQTVELLWDSSIYRAIQGHNPNISSPWASGRFLYEKMILP